MFNQTECYSNQDKELHGDSIVAIVVAGCSLAATLGTFAYFKLISKFKDMQQSEIELTTEQNGDTNKTVIKVKFVNDEQFEVSSKSAKNGKDEESNLTPKKVLDNLTSIISSEKSSPSKANSGIDMTEIVVTNFHDAIDNNNAGDKIIAVTRKGLILNAFNTFLKTVKVYNVAEEHVIDISENHSRSNSAHFNYSRTNSDLDETPVNDLVDKHRVYIPHPTPKIIHRRSLPEVKSAEKKTAIPELSLKEQLQAKSCVLEIKDEVSSDNDGNTTNPTTPSSSDSNQDKKLDWQVQLQTVLSTAQSLNEADSEQIHLDRFKPIASKKRGSLAPLIESNDESSHNDIYQSTSVTGAVVEDTSAEL